ncbi:sigma-70 family RNA polymerase sigma factor [Nonomuraea sp. NPDC050310]|uniref:RNA polymerase sigma factor n=1 Tax=unclassified Nonomuraea TaxID=2593643 RepID=UPI0033C6249D
MSIETDRERFEAVYHATYEQLLGYAARRCDRPEDAADAVAETYLIAWRRIDRLPRDGEARLWLYGVARKVLAGQRRKRHNRRERVAELDAELAELFGGHSPFGTPESSVELAAITRLFRELPEADRELLSLLAWEGLDHAELATVLGISRNAVRVRLHRARRRFARLLARDGLPVHHLALESL